MKHPSLLPLALLAWVAFVAVPSAEARGWNQKQIQKANRAEEKQEQKERQAREKRSKAIDQFMLARDGDNDGSLTKDEFQSRETDKPASAAKFDKFNKNGDRYLSKSEIATMLGF